jgi:uncharacterized protein involved in outer membrane biogenesis
MRKLLWVLAIVAVVLVGVRYGVLNDDNVARFLETWLSTKMDRELAVEGEFEVELGNPLRVRATQVRLANPPWAEDPIMARAAEVKAAVDLTTIYGDKPLIITELIITTLDGELLSNEDGDANWEFGRPDSDGSTNFLIQEIEVTEGNLEVRRPEFAPVDFQIERLRQVENAEGLLETSLVGSYNNRPVDGNGLVGPFRNLLEGENIRIALSANIGTLAIDGSGTIDSLENPRQPKFSLEAKAPDAPEVAAMFGVEFDTPSDIQLKLEVEPEEVGIRFRAGGRWATTNLGAIGRVRDLPSLDGVVLSGRGNGPSLRGALRLFGFPDAPDLPFRFDGDLSRDGELLDVREVEFSIGGFRAELIGDMNRFPSFNEANLKLSAKGDDVAAFRDVLGIPGVAEGDFWLEAEIGRSNSGEDIFRVRARTDLGKGSISGTLGPAPDYIGTRVSYRGDGVSLGKLAEVFLLTEFRDQPFVVTGEAEIVPGGIQLLNGQFTSGETIVEANGLIAADDRLVGTELDWNIKNVDLAEIGQLANAGRAAEQALDLPSRKISATGKSLVRPNDIVLSGVEGMIGESEFTVTGQLGSAQSFRGTDIRLSLRGPDLERAALLVTNINTPEGPYEFAGRIQRTAKGLRVSESQFTVAGAEGMVNFEVALPIEKLDANFDVEITGPDLSKFWEKRFNIDFGQQAFEVDLRGQLTDDIVQLDDGRLVVGESIIQATGRIQRGANENAVRIRATSPEMSDIAKVFGLELFPGRELEMAGTLRRRGEHFRLENFLARTNKGDLAGTIDIYPGEPLSIKGELTSELLDISWLTDPVEDELLKEQLDEKKPEGGDGRLIPDWPLPIDDLKRVNVDLSVTADEVYRERRDVRNAYLRLVIENGELHLSPYRFGGSSGTLDAELHVVPSNAGADVEFRLMATDLVTGLFQPDNEDLTLMPKGDWEIDIKTSGHTVRQLAGNMDGTGQLSSKSGRLSNQGRTNALFGDLLGNIVRSVNPFAEQEPYTEITCAVFPFVFEDGIMNTAPSIVVQTDKLNILSRGDIDLRTERVNLSFNSKPRRGLGVSAGSLVNPFVRIGGTMAEPSVALDRTGAILTGGAAFFTAGLSLIAKAAFDAAWRSPDPCGRVLEEADKRFAKANGRNRRDREDRGRAN